MSLYRLWVYVHAVQLHKEKVSEVHGYGNNGHCGKYVTVLKKHMTPALPALQRKPEQKGGS